MLVLVPDTLAIIKKTCNNLEWLHTRGPLFYVETEDLIWSNGQVASSNPKERGHLQETIGGQFRNSGSPEGRKLRGDGGFVVARPSLVKGPRGISINASLPLLHLLPLCP
jgi:hypothetical protein